MAFGSSDFYQVCAGLALLIGITLEQVGGK